MADAPTGVSRALREAPPDRVVEAADLAIRSILGASGTAVFIADYRISGLWPVLDSRQPGMAGQALQGTVQRCFSSQQPVRTAGDDGRSRLYVPLSVWGERLGVLMVELPGEPPETVVRRAVDIAGEVALALRAADRKTDRYRRACRQERLSMAAELQWELLPGRSVSHGSFHLAGQLEPAYTVGGDHFDWSLDDGRLTVTVLNGDGIGLTATLLTVVTVNAMRNARRSGGGLVEQAELASDTVFYQHQGHRHVATVLLELDSATGRVRAVDAGSPHLLRLRGGSVSRVALEQQLPLGMFAETRYDLQEFDLDPGDRLFVVSDGVWAADPSGRETYGERAMARSMRATRLQPPTDAVGTVMRELQAFHAEADLRDDAVVVCLDWRGLAGREHG
ncbi:Serine phosphatase RsbU, regulator of sigma subunit [Micromonospora phaseoli]|uniref:Serine phosphatase RsbU, regulator of sigma subunit n=1 Tax=Micromonospora phaseoli TaxID=1144548 RepID=A0A1H6U8D8_9ACTN|nr:PP2C family protein-serine/threonine phosphatase [Micromonospora phaseoli]PZV98781.1 serine phosphatase RsbU (regulator of sigma subunit) [Micromonospora phaseoli]GIJ76469.1 phosphatase [Micromonospora phaseoli]SEI84560.1 Serine phosphatase RsbU, regulator of sigma subunit [Micromonospora phaseoli]